MAFAPRPCGDRVRRADDRPRRVDPGARARDHPGAVPVARRRGACTSATTWRSSPSWPTASRSCTPGGSSSTARATRCSARRRHPYTRRLLRAVPDVGGRRGIVGIAGHAPLPGERPGGCTFHPRCSLASERCAVEVPPETTVGAGWTVRCLRADVPGRAARRDDRAGRCARSPTTTRCSASPALTRRLRRPCACCYDIELAVGRNRCVAIVGESGSRQDHAGALPRRAAPRVDRQRALRGRAAGRRRPRAARARRAATSSTSSRTRTRR